MENKTCSCCEEIKDITCFTKLGKYIGPDSKSCQSKKHKIYNNSEKGREANRKYMSDHKEDITQYRKMYDKEHHILCYEQHKEEIPKKKKRVK